VIPRDQCKNRQLYRIHSRNLSFGVFHEENGGFFGLRKKFNYVFVFEEFHWDNGPPYGTVKPLEELPEILPERIALATDLGTICSECRAASSYVKYPEGEREKTYEDGRKMMFSGEWKHLEPTDCREVSPMSKSNSVLERWLKRMEKKYKVPDQ
jgi:hypothetical protein